MEINSPKEPRQKQKTNGWINPSRLAGWGQPGAKIQPKKKLF